MPSEPHPAAVPAKPGSPANSASQSRPRRRRWLWFGLAAALIALLFGGRGIAAACIHSMARGCISSRHSEQALEWLTWCDRIDRRDGEAEFLRARAYRKLGQFTQVRDHLQRAHKLGISVPRLDREQILAHAQSGQLTEAEPFLGMLLSNPENDSEEICEAFVNGFSINRRYADAFRLIEPWIADYPGHAYPHYVRGHLQLELRRTKEAEADLRKAIELDPSHNATAFELADALQKLNRPEDALAFYRQAAKSPRFEVMGKVGESRCLTVLGHSDQARALIAQILEKHPQDVEANKTLGQIELEAGNFAAALKHFDLAMTRLAYLPDLRSARGSALRGLRRMDEARAEFDFVKVASAEMARSNDLRDEIQADPTNYQLRYEVGKILLKYSVPQEGVIWLQSVFNYSPHHRGAHQALADYYSSRAREDPAFQKLADFHLNEARTDPVAEENAENTK